MAIKLDKKVYDRGIKTTEVIILVLFALSAILMGMSQINSSKAMEINIENMNNLEKVIIANQFSIEATLHHLTSCNTIDMLQYVEKPFSHEFESLIEKTKEMCVDTELINDTKELASELLIFADETRKSNSNNLQEYLDKSTMYAGFAFFTFVAGLVLCFMLFLDLHLFEPKD